MSGIMGDTNVENLRTYWQKYALILSDNWRVLFLDIYRCCTSLETVKQNILVYSVLLFVMIHAIIRNHYVYILLAYYIGSIVEQLNITTTCIFLSQIKTNIVFSSNTQTIEMNV